MKIVIYIFVFCWLPVAIFGFMQPRKVISNFSTLSKVLGLNPNTIDDKGLILFRIICVFFILLGIFILVNMITGRLEF